MKVLQLWLEPRTVRMVICLSMLTVVFSFLCVALPGPVRAETAALNPGDITTVAGNGTRGYSGDGGLATNAQLKSSYDVVMDNSGNIYIADSANYRVRMVAGTTGTYYGIPMTAGNIYTVAGDGISGYDGDGGPAIDAKLKSVYGLAVDSAGNIYISDQGNYRIRKVDPSGTITTVAGSGTRGYSGDGGLATNAQLNGGYGLAVDNAGNLYIADGSSYRVRMVAAMTGTKYGIAVTAGNIYTIAGDGTSGYTGNGGSATSAQLGTAYDIAIDNTGNLYIADNCTVREVDPSGIITSVAGDGTSGYSGDGGLATGAQLRPYSLAVDSNGDIYIAEKGNCCVRRVDAGSGMIFTVAGGNGSGSAGDGGPANSSKLNPYGIAVDSTGNLYIADQAGYSVRYVQSPAAVSTLAGLSVSGSPDLTYNGAPLTYDLDGISLIGTDQYGSVYDLTGKTVTWKVKSGPAEVNGSNLTIVRGGTVELTVQVLGVVSDIFNLNVNTGELPVVNPNIGDITTLAGIGIKGYEGDGAPAINGMLNSPHGVAVDSAGNIFIADTDNNRIRVVAAVNGSQYGINMIAGNIYTVAGTGTRGYSGDGGPATSAQLSQTEGIAVDQAGNIYIGELGNPRIRQINTSGIITTVAGNGESGYAGDGGPATDAQLTHPWGVAVDSDGNIFIGSDNYTVRMVAAVTGTKYGVAVTAGNIYTVAGTGDAGYSGDGGPATSALLRTNGKILVDSTGNLFIADCYNNCVRKVDPNGIITTVAGTGTEGYSGDCGPAVSAQFKYPSELAMDSSGNLYIADVGNYRIRNVNPSGIITTVAGDGTSGYSGDGGPAISARVGFTGGVETDNDGNLYISDANNHCVRFIKLALDEAPDLAALSLSGSPNLSYSGTPFNYDLGGLTLTGEDQSGIACDLTGQTVTWAVHSGPATVSGSTLTITGSGTVSVSASVYNVTSNILSLIVTDSGADPPVLAADISDKIIGQDDVEITFIDDPAWRGAINTVSIDGAVLDAEKYSKDTAGKIIIDADVIEEAGEYVIVIKATGYSDASVVQKIISAEVVLEITGDGVTNHLTFTLAQLQEMEQYRHLYSTINKWPSKKWYVGEGVKLKDLLTLAGIKENAQLVKLTARDGYTAVFTVQELLSDKRYLFPHFIEPVDGHIPGSAADAEEVQTILALKSSSSDNFDTMSDCDALHLIVGQRAVSEQMNDAYVKYVNKVEVFTVTPSKWESPTANPDGGNVTAGTLVTLSTPDMDGDKIYYTTDGSTPTLNSTMYNPIGKEWWSSRQDVLSSINHPIEIARDTTIKTIAIGPGKLDSDVVEFRYTVAEQPVPVTSISIVQDNQKLDEGQTVQLAVYVEPENATNKAVTWYSSNEAIATVSETGLVTAVAEGTATITVTADDGGFTDGITVTVDPRSSYEVILVNDATYSAGTTSDGISTMTVNDGIFGLNYFTIRIKPEIPHSGNENVVFTHLRNDNQLGLNATGADFDQGGVDTAQAGFNVQPNDVIKAYVVDALTSSTGQNPVILQ